MPVIQAKSAGFCYGVRRAVELAEKTARETGGCVMLGNIIHNANVVARLEQLGARQVDNQDADRPGDKVLIRSRGETRQVLERLEALGARRVCTSSLSCPGPGRPGAVPWASASPITRRSWARPAGGTGPWCFRGRRSWSGGCWRTRLAGTCP